MEVEARGKRRTVYLTDNLWRLTRSWAIANDQTVSEVVEQTLLHALTGLRPGAVAEAQKAVRRPLEPLAERVADSVLDRLTADATLVKPHPVDSAPIEPGVKFGRAAFSEFRPAPKPGPKKRREASTR